MSLLRTENKSWVRRRIALPEVNHAELGRKMVACMTRIKEVRAEKNAVMERYKAQEEELARELDALHRAPGLTEGHEDVECVVCYDVEAGEVVLVAPDGSEAGRGVMSHEQKAEAAGMRANASIACNE